MNVRWHSYFKEISIPINSDLVKYIEPEMTELLTSAIVPTSPDVAEYEETTGILYMLGCDVEIMTQKLYAPEMRACAIDLMSVGSAELESYITLTDELRSKYADLSQTRPRAN